MVQTTEKPGGIGEPVTSVVAPGLATAMSAADGKRLRTLRFSAANIARA